MQPASRHHKQHAYRALYRQHVGRVYAYCFRRTGNRADAEDLTEQVFTEAWEKFTEYEERGRAAAWLFAIAHSRVVDFYRRRRPQVPFDERLDRPGDGLTPEQRVLQREQHDHLLQRLQALDPDRQELILLRFGGELSYREIGEIVGKSEAAVKMSIYRILEQLRATWSVGEWPQAAPELAEDDYE